MMRFISVFAMFIAVLGFLPTQAAAQPYGTWAYCNGVWRPGSCSGQPIYNGYNNGYPYGGYPVQQVVPQVMPNLGNAINNCSVIGATLGGIVGNQIDRHHIGGTIAGALLGGAVGNVVCNSGGQRVIVQQPQPVQYVQTAQPQTVVYTTQNAVAAVPQSMRGVMCNIDGVVTEVSSNEACRQVAFEKAQTLVAKTDSVSTVSGSYDQGPSGISSERQEAIKHACKSPTAEWRKLNWPGHPQHEKFVCMEPDDTHRF